MLSIFQVCFFLYSRSAANMPSCRTIHFQYWPIIESIASTHTLVANERDVRPNEFAMKIASQSPFDSAFSELVFSHAFFAWHWQFCCAASTVDNKSKSTSSFFLFLDEFVVCREHFVLSRTFFSVCHSYVCWFGYTHCHIMTMAEKSARERAI